MGGVKHWMHQQDEKRQVAIEIALKVGLLTKCEAHDYVLDPIRNNHEDAYKLANSLITMGDPLVDLFKGDRRELTDLIKDICNDHGEECPGCASAMKD